MGANNSWPVFRDVTDPMFAGGAKGDGVHGDTEAINGKSYGAQRLYLFALFFSCIFFSFISSTLHCSLSAFNFQHADHM